MKHKILPAFGICLMLGALTAHAASSVTISPLSAFGGGDGWLSPGEGGYSFLGTANNERGLGYGNGHLYLVSRSGGNSIRILNPTTGADIGGLNVSGITGGTFAVNNIGVAGDGVIYVNNLTTQSTTSPLKVYSWLTEGSVPTVSYSGDGALPGARVGDSFAAIGSGSSTRLALGYGSSPTVTGNNGYSIVNPTTGTATAVGFSGTPPNAGDFRLGISFTDSSHVVGSQGSTLFRYTSFSAGAGTLLASPALSGTADRLLAYDVLRGTPLLAVQSTGDSHVSIFDLSDPINPTLLLQANNTSGTLTANPNGTGQLAWGDTTVNGDGSVSQTLYAMSSNQGIQAFVVTVPEPGAFALAALGLAALAIGRKVRK
jgi:Domain of unknown function (DUF4623)/PEP-CTERM motif